MSKGNNHLKIKDMKVQDYLKNRSKNEIQNETLVEMIISVEHEAEERIAQALKHYEAGKRDCKNGIYDKWYRYNTYHRWSGL